MRLLVTGGTGFIGSHLVHRLLATGAAVTLLVREHYSGAPLPPSLAPIRAELDLVYADLRNFQLTARAVRQAEPEAVIHLAAAGATDPFLGLDTALRHNLTGTLNLMRACFEKGGPAQRLIIARTPGERTAMNVYAASKAAAWQFAQMYSGTHRWPIHGAMIFQAYGPGQPRATLVQAAATAALTGEDFPMTSGRQLRDWIYVADVAAGLVAMLAADLEPGITVDLGTGIGTPLSDVVERIYRLTDAGGQPRPGLLPDRPGEADHQIADATQSVQQLGWRAATGLDEGLRLTLSHLRA